MPPILPKTHHVQSKHSQSPTSEITDMDIDNQHGLASMDLDSPDYTSHGPLHDPVQALLGSWQMPPNNLHTH